MVSRTEFLDILKVAEHSRRAIATVVIVVVVVVVVVVPLLQVLVLVMARLHLGCIATK